MTENLTKLAEQFQKLTFKEMMIFADDLAHSMQDTANQGVVIDAVGVATFLDEATAGFLEDADPHPHELRENG